MGSVFLGESFSNLRSLTMDSNLMTELWGLRRLRLLSVLRVNDNRLSDISFDLPPEVLAEQLSLQPSEGPTGAAPPHPFRAIQALFMNGNQVPSIAGLRLSGLGNLRILHLANNEINKIEGLEGLVHLRASL